MSAPKDTMCRSIPCHFMKRKVAHTTTGIQSASTMPLQRPSERKDAAMTITMASKSDSVKSWMDSFTTFG